VLDLLKFDISASNAKAVGALRDTKRELGGIKGALVNVNDYARRAGKSMRNIGAGMTAAVSAPIALLGKQSVELYDIQKRAEDAVATVIASTDGAAGRSLGDLKALASQMQRVSNFGDENILQNVTAPLLTFTNIQDDVFDRAQANVLDMATLLKMDLKSASVLVGKALNDPIKGMSALSRSGVTFSASQEDVIKALVATGDVAGAQAVILEELERQFGGQAEAAAKAPLGAFRQLQNAIGDVKESLGEQIVPFLTPLVEKVQEAVSWFGQLSPEVKKNIVIFGGIAAVAGPVLAFLGLATLGVMALAGGFGLLASPIALVVLGFAALAAGATWVVTNWDALKERFPIFEQAASLAARLREAWSNLPAIKWLALIPALLWARFIPALVWSVYVKAIAWAALAGSLTWSSLVTALVWGARFIPVIGWAALAGTLIWSMIIKPLGWADFIAKIDWSQYVPEINWDNLIGGKSAGSKARKDGREVGTQLGAGLAEGVQAATPTGTSAGRKLIRDTVNATKSEAGVQSPSRVFRQIGDFLGQGLALGIRGSAPQAVGAMTDTANQIIAEGQKTTGFLGSFKGGVNTILTDVLSGAKTFGESLRGVINGAGNRLFSTGVSGLTDWVTGLFGFADGAAFSGGRVMAFADGGVVSGPVTFPMQGGSGLMGEAGPEAIMPLTRIGGKLGVRASGGGGAQMRDRVDVYLHPSAEFDARVETGAAQVYDAREAGTIGKAVGATYSAARERPLR